MAVIGASLVAMRRATTLWLSVALAAACGKSDHPGSSTTSGGDSPGAVDKAGGTAAAGGEPAAAADDQAASGAGLGPVPASVAAAAAQRAFDRYLTATTGLWREFGAVMDAADRKGATGFDHARMRGALDRFLGELDAVDRELASAAADPAFNLELCLACVDRDWNLNGRIDDGDRLLFQVEVDDQGNPLAEDDPRRKPTFRFDVGDLYWARAMLAFQRAVVDLVLAYDWSGLDRLLRWDQDRPPPPITIKLGDAGRVRAARDLILAGVDHAERARQAYLAETDDDREWVPSPRQKNHPVPLAMDQAMYDRWGAILGDVRRLVHGDEGLSAGQIGALLDDDFAGVSGFIDVGRALDKPADFVLDFTILDDRRIGPVRGAEKILRDFFGQAYRPTMKPSPLPGRLARMKSELERDQDTFDRKLRYLLWLN